MTYFDFNQVNENMGVSSTAGYSMATMSGDASTGFLYKVMPLSFNMMQSDAPRKEHVHDHFKYYPGHKVKGISPYDKKTHTGIIKHIYNDPDTDKPVLVYILDLENNNIIPLDADSIKNKK